MGFDSKFENGRVVTPDGLGRATVAVRDGTIAAVGEPGSLGAADRVVDLEGQYLLPGIVDCHIHTRSPGDEHKEDWATATAAAAAGGVTTVIAMPNTDPMVDSPATLDRVYDIAGRDARVDFQSYAVLTSENYDRVVELAEAGAAGFKVFLGTTFGDIEPPDDGQLYAAMGDAATVGKRIGFHEENDDILSHVEARFREEGRDRPIDHARSRPVVAEAEAVSRIILLADHAGCPVHMFHLSSGTGAQLVARGKRDGVNVTAETCPHYLWFTEDVIEEKGNVARVQPPIRDADERDRLWEVGVHGTGVDCIATDHAPHTDAEKSAAEPFANTWESISGFVGLESEVPAMSTFVSEGRVGLAQWAYMHSTRPAQLWGLYPRKGSLRVGTDADFTVVDPDREWVLDREDLHSRSTTTPFDGERFVGRATMTVVRGTVVYEDGELHVEEGYGQRVPSGETVSNPWPRRDETVTVR
jgi:dihydroorotase/allantoinase